MAYPAVTLLLVLVPLISAEFNISETVTEEIFNFTVSAIENVTHVVTAGKKADYPDVIDCNVHHGLIINPFVQSGCDRYFYACDYFFGIRMECPLDLFFDPNTRDCLPWHDVTVCSGITRTTSSPHSTTFHGHTVTFDHERFDCVKRANGNYADVTAEKPRCSTRYITCDNGKLVLNWCFPGFFFDEYNDRCDAYPNVFDCSGRTHVPTEPHSTVMPHIVEFDCMNKTSGLYPNPLKKCDRTFYMCGDGIAYEEECPAYLVFDFEKQNCLRREDVFDCSGIHISTTVAPPTRTPKFASNFQCIAFPDGSIHQDPDKSCAGYFIECIAERAVIMDCPPGLFFNNETSNCDYRWNIASCRRSNWPSFPSVNSQSTTVEVVKIVRTTPAEEIATERTTPVHEITTERTTPIQKITTERNTPVQKITTERTTPLREITTERVTPVEEVTTERIPLHVITTERAGERVPTSREDLTKIKRRKFFKHRF